MQRRPVMVAFAVAVTACQQLPTGPLASEQAIQDQPVVSTARNNALTTDVAPDVGGVIIGRARTRRYGGYYGLGYYGPGYYGRGYYGPGYYGYSYYGLGHYGLGHYGLGHYGLGHYGRGYYGRGFYGYRRCGRGWC